MTASFRVVAIVAAYNEEDIIEACLEHLYAQGVQTYHLDDGSTDATASRAEKFRGRGLIDIERLEPTAPAIFSLERILARKEALTRELEARWFINHDADEFRESAWAELTLAGAIAHVDELGWNAIDFEIFNIRPHGSPDASVSPSHQVVRYARAADHDRPQVRAWKNLGIPVDLRASAGHDVEFAGRRVFPIPFPMRHYPLRSTAHGRRKILGERLARFDSSERERGWHVQYDGVSADDVVVPTVSLTPYDPVLARIRCALANRDLEYAERRIDQLVGQCERVEEDAAQAREMTALVTAERDSLIASLGQVEKALDAAVSARDQAIRATSDLQQLTAQANHERDSTAAQNERLSGDIALLRDQLSALYESRSWRWTHFLRALAKPLLPR
jgi:glycosyltransferase involved in cell wall biosynthesis